MENNKRYFFEPPQLLNAMGFPSLHIMRFGYHRDD